MAVGMGDIGPDQLEYPWISAKRSLGELGEYSIVAGRQVGAAFANLRIYLVVIIQKPLRRRHNRAPGAKLKATGPARDKQGDGVVFQSTLQRCNARW